MTDQTPAPAPAPSTGTVGVDANAVASDVRTLVAAGHMTQAQADEAIKQAAGTVSPGNTLGTPAAEPGAIKITTGGTFTPEQLTAMAQDMVTAGKLSRADANEALKTEGLPPLVEPSAAEGDVAELDAAFPAAKSPAEYEMPPLTTSPDQPLTPEMKAFDTSARSWLMAAEVPANIGTSMLKEGDRVAKFYPKMPDGERQAWILGERAKLQKIYCNNLDRKIALGKQLVRELEAKQPGIVEYLERSGAGNSALFGAQLIRTAERLQARRAAK